MAGLVLLTSVGTRSWELMAKGRKVVVSERYRNRKGN